MSETVIKVENLSKQYQLGVVGTGTLRRDLQRWYSRIRGKEDPTLKIGQENVLSAQRLTPDASRPSDFVWALKDINFEVKQGEVLGIIGKNGAGKSTLLKILSQVTSPTIGEIKVKGRIASLLEVGTGFHPELTGRENIFLNGAILGMTKSEIRSKFDEIVDFSGVEKYIDTPVKRYSSGMYVRLAFAVAAHLEPEILVVDEVLAVWDAEFQKKAIGKMQDVSNREGRTVLFVSHNMAAIQNLCSQCVLLKNGNIDSIGLTGKVINIYLNEVKHQFSQDLRERIDRKGNGVLRFTEIKFLNEDNSATNCFISGQNYIIEISLFATKKIDSRLHISVGISDSSDHRITYLNSDFTPKNIERVEKGENKIQIMVPKLCLQQGNYSLTLFSKVNEEISDWIIHAASIQVENGDYYNCGKVPPVGQGIFLMEHTFNIKK
jgi:lipopolysaccharide transport system ATP-binding protein